MTKIHHWESKKSITTTLPKKVFRQYFNQTQYSLSQITSIFKQSFADYQAKKLSLKLFSEISNQLFNYLIHHQQENSPITDIILIASEINFYTQSSQTKMVQNILIDIQNFINQTNSDPKD